MLQTLPLQELFQLFGHWLQGELVVDSAVWSSKVTHQHHTTAFLQHVLDAGQSSDYPVAMQSKL